MPSGSNEIATDNRDRIVDLVMTETILVIRGIFKFLYYIEVSTVRYNEVSTI
jgi:hypothetical protein